MMRIIKSGFLSSIQGNYRKGYLQMGIPWSGPMDDLSMYGANYLTGNEPDTSVIEMFVRGPEIRFEKKVRFAICGANMTPRINGKEIPQDELITAGEGDNLSFGSSRNGMVTYLSFAGEPEIKPYLDSTSTNLTAGLGGFKGRPLRTGDLLILNKPRLINPVTLPNFFRYISQKHTKLRIVEGPETFRLNDESKNKFVSAEYRVSNKSNRMGIRLISDKPVASQQNGIVSSAILPGTIQLPENGQPIVMMRDHQTTGGYLRIGKVIDHDLSYLAQAIHGEKVSFRWINLEKSTGLYLKKHKKIKQLFADRQFSSP